MKHSVIILCCVLAIAACNKDTIQPKFSEGDSNTGATLVFDSAEELNAYAEELNTGGHVSTKTSGMAEDGFVSLWDKQISDFYATLSEDDLRKALNDGLVYEPEDEIIADPIFAKIVNAEREVSVGDYTYRYVSTGVLIYTRDTDKTVIDNIDCSYFNDIPDRQEVQINSGVRFVRIHYNLPMVFDEMETRAPIVEPGVNGDELVTKNGIVIKGDKLRYVKYEKGGGDASGFQKTISGIFGTSVVATNYFNNDHRMKLRTFSQDYVVYTSVGMTVRMQHKRLGVWWRREAEEFRYGWTGVECKYTYTGPSFPAGVTLHDIDDINQPTNYYDKPLLLFTVPLVDYKVTNVKVGALLKTMLQKNQTKINNWLNNNQDCKNNPRSVFAAETDYTYSMIYPQYEEVAYKDGREEVKWDFRVHFQAGVNIGSSVTPTFSPVKDPEKIEIHRGEIYAACKYGEWRACVIVVD